MVDEQVPPHVIIIAGPNGAGKSTAAPQLLQGALSVSEFVNADVIARGLSAFEPDRDDMEVILQSEDHWPRSYCRRGSGLGAENSASRDLG